MSDLFQQEYINYKWDPWTYKSGGFSSLKKASPAIPPKYGVYIIRAPHEINRTKGASNIIYIGQSGGGVRKGKQGIGTGNSSRGRIFNTRGKDKIIREMIESLYLNKGFIIECYFTMPDEDPKKIEGILLELYVKTYYELPPANHQF